jgi:6-pyruvoyltetrahydropterin/6-carboxytetrahydropterin synthase
MKVTVARKVHFNAAHRLHRHDWTMEKNDAVFGKCNNPNFHGHNYDLIVKVTGEIDPETGYVVDMKWLKDLIEAQIVDYLDHKNLNLDIPEFKSLNPTAENIAVLIWQRLRKVLDPKLELLVQLFETERNFVEFAG